MLERGKVVAERVAEGGRARGSPASGPHAGETISEFAGKVGEVARKAKEEVGTAAQDEKLTLDHLKAGASSAVEDITQDPEASAQKK